MNYEFQRLKVFFDRWVLIAFKREFPFDEVLRLWEVLWTDYYSTQFVLFVALAVLESHRDMILRYLVEVSFVPLHSCSLSLTFIQFDEILKVIFSFWASRIEPNTA